MSEQRNMLKLKRIFEYFEGLARDPKPYIYPVTPETLFSHSQALATGVILSIDTLTSHDLISARQHANRLRGWQSRATGVYMEMREKGYDDTAIIQELVQVEIKMWEILDQWEKENMSKIGKSE